MTDRRGRWRGDPNRGSGREEASAPSARTVLHGSVRWTDPDRALIHVEVEDRDGVRDPLEGEVIALDLTRVRLRIDLTDRDGDGRIDLADIVPGDRVQATVTDPARINPSEPVKSVRKVRVTRS